MIDETANLVTSKTGQKVLRNLASTLPEALMFRQAARDGRDHSEVVASKREMLGRARSIGLRAPQHMQRRSTGSLNSMIDGQPEPPRPVAIYGLCSSIDNVFRYVGKANNPRKRLGGHISESEAGESPKDKWVSETYRDGTLRMTVLEWTLDWREAERRWIKKARGRSGRRLFNISEGG